VNPETVIQLRQQLEAIKEFEQKNAPRKFSYAGYWGEFLAGLFFLGESILLPIFDAQRLPHVVMYVCGASMAFQGFYLIVRYKIDKRMKLLLEAMLSIGEARRS
jgi:hypothetical protein